jgi:hypothetical protein
MDNQQDSLSKAFWSLMPNHRFSLPVRPKMDSTVVEVYSALNLQQAHLVVAALDDAGIEGHIVNDGLDAAAGKLPLGWTTAPRIWVLQADADRAQEVIADWERACSPDRPREQLEPWTCAGCGTSVEGNFEVCWNCLQSR